MIDIKQIEIDQNVLIQRTYKNMDSFTFTAKVLAVNETEIQLQLIAFWAGHIAEENIELNTSSNRPPFATTETAILKIPVAGILRIMPAGTRKVIQMKKYT